MNPLTHLMAISSIGLFTAGCGSSSSTSTKSQSPVPISVLEINTIWSLGTTINQIWDGHIAGHPAGAISLTAATCPNGGTVDISGNTSVGSNGIDTFDLTYQMHNCRSILIAATFQIDRSFSGSIKGQGSFRSSGNNQYGDRTFTSTALTVTGIDEPMRSSTSPRKAPPVDFEQVPFNEHISSQGDHGTTSGSVNGHVHSWTWGPGSSMKGPDG